MGMSGIFWIVESPCMEENGQRECENKTEQEQRKEMSKTSTATVFGRRAEFFHLCSASTTIMSHPS